MAVIPVRLAFTQVQTFRYIRREQAGAGIPSPQRATGAPAQATAQKYLATIQRLTVLEFHWKIAAG
jgi:hypothetical protein